MLEKNEKEIKRISERIEVLEADNSGELGVSKASLMMAGLLSFLIGYWLG